MPVLALVETTDNQRGRFLASTFEDAIRELSRNFPVGATVTDRLRRGEAIVTDAYRLRIVPFEASTPKRQQSLFG